MPTTSNFGWTTPADTDLVKDGALAIRTLGNGIDTSMAQLKGGTTGQVLSKTNGTDMAFTWVTQDDANAIQNAIVDAKGDLIAATANDTPARLAVGNNGETLVADSSATTGLRWQATNAAGKNAAINGGMDIWQRGTSFALAANTLTFAADRWQGKVTGTVTNTYSRVATNDTTNLPFIQYALRLQRTSGQTATPVFVLAQNIETINSIPFAGKTVTLSFYARRGANFSSASNALTAELYSGTGTDQSIYSTWTGSATPISSNVTLTTTWQRFSLTGTVASTATELAIYFAHTPSGTAGADDWYEITGVQLEVGSVATSFTRIGGTIAGELAACKRYYAKYSFTSGRNITVFAAYASGSAYGKLFDFQTEMRTAPSVTMTGIGNLKPMNSSGSGSTTTVFSGGATDFNATANTLFANGFTGSSGLTAGNTTVIASSGGTVEWEVSAEL